MTKAVIACAGMGTRFYPIASVLPKEMLPLFNKPILHYIVYDMIKAGINQICFIINDKKQAIVDYFKHNYQAISVLKQLGNIKDSEQLQFIYDNASFDFIMQDKPLGTADAVMRAKNWVGDNEFLLSWGDDIIFSHEHIDQLKAAMSLHQAQVVGVKVVLDDSITKYGVLQVDKSCDNSCDNNLTVFKCSGMVEKPPLSSLPSRYASIGKYALTQDIFKYIAKTKPGIKGELFFTDSLQLACDKGVYGCVLNGDRYDLGDAQSMLNATNQLAKDW